MTAPKISRRKGARPEASGRPLPPHAHKLNGVEKQVKDNFKAWEARRGFAPRPRGFNSMDFKSKGAA